MDFVTIEELEKRLEAGDPFSAEHRALRNKRHIRTFVEWCDRQERDEEMAIYRLKVSHSIVDMKTTCSLMASRPSCCVGLCFRELLYRYENRALSGLGISESS